MIIVELTGGLGNQLFQYAAAKSLSLHHKVELLLDTSSFYRNELPELEVPRNYELFSFEGITEKEINLSEIEDNRQFLFLKKRNIEKVLPKYKRTIYKEPFYYFDSNFFRSSQNVLLKGGWQSEKYFKDSKKEILSSLRFKDAIIQNIKSTAKLFSGAQTVAVHIRRGDYLRKKIILEWHGVLDKEYYIQSLNELSKKISSFEIIYFSDDIEWIEKELIPIMPGKIITNKISKNHFEDFYLMSQCKHNIIANSSFSWWAAWLNKNPDKIVIAPHKWFDKANLNTKDLIPESWIRI